MVNTTHDTVDYDQYGYTHAINDANVLYDAYLRAKQGSDWKSHVQKFEMMYLLNLADMQRDLESKTYEFYPLTSFILKERGKERLINGEKLPDRIVKHAVCDHDLNPAVRKYLIYDNGASLEGRGIDFTRRRLMADLSKYYRKHGNQGYILLMDYKRYYDNIRHDELMKLFKKYVTDDLSLWVLEKTLERARIDVSYMTDKEFNNCMNTLFDSIRYSKIDKSLLIGKKIMRKHLNVGDQVAQTAGVLYPMKIDNYIKIVRGEKHYARYMDDSYIIHFSKEHLQNLLKDIIKIADSIGITINTKKTRICRLDDYWRFLQIQYSLENTGRIVRKINPKRLTDMRRKMKKLAPKMDKLGFHQYFKAWFKNHRKYMSNKQKENLLILYKEVTGNVYINFCRRYSA